jgi:SAM-dependent methyltransferase
VTTATSADHRAVRRERDTLLALETTKVIDAASALGVFSVLTEGPVSEGALADALGTDARLTGLLCRALVAVGAVDRSRDGVVSLTPLVEALDLLDGLWSALPEVTRTGRPLMDVGLPDDARALYGPLVHWIDRLASPHRGRFVDALAGTGPRILDLGAGTAPWSRALAEADASRHLTAVDLPDVSGQTEAALADAGLTGRSRVVVGDLFALESTADLGGDFDVVIVAQVCRLFAPEAAAELVARAARFLGPGGTLAVVDALPDEDRHDGTSNALYQLGLALRTRSGGVHRWADYQRWLGAAGLAGSGRISLGSPELTLMCATRPGARSVAGVGAPDGT